MTEPHWRTNLKRIAEIDVELQNLRNKGKKEKKAEKTSLPVTDKKAFEAPVFEEPATSAEPLEERVSEAESDFDAWDDDDGLYD